MENLIIAALVWVGVHVGLAGTPLRGALVRAIGEAGFRALFSVLSVGAIAWLVQSYNASETELLWVAPDWLRWAVAVLMLPSFILLAGAFTQPNPTAVGGRLGANRTPHGIQRITRHPMMVAVTVWAASHMAVNGDTAALLFFGAFLVTAVAGMPSIDAKLRARDHAGWQNLVQHTSILPFGAILAGRNSLRLGEIGWLAPVLGLLLWAAMLHFHKALFGVAPVTMG
jgi:uncharacterized membrane protein